MLAVALQRGISLVFTARRYASAV